MTSLDNKLSKSFQRLSITQAKLIDTLKESLKACEAERGLLEINFLSETKTALKLEEKLKACEAEKLSIIGSRDIWCKEHKEVEEKLHALEKIAREGFMEIYEKCKTLPECESIAELALYELNKLMNARYAGRG